MCALSICGPWPIYGRIDVTSARSLSIGANFEYSLNRHWPERNMTTKVPIPCVWKSKNTRSTLRLVVHTTSRDISTCDLRSTFAHMGIHICIYFEYVTRTTNDTAKTSNHTYFIRFIIWMITAKTKNDFWIHLSSTYFGRMNFSARSTNSQLGFDKTTKSIHIVSKIRIILFLPTDLFYFIYFILMQAHSFELVKYYFDASESALSESRRLRLERMKL